MKELVLKITHDNWGLVGPDSWNNVEWKVYDDLSVDIKILYNSITNGENIKIINSKLIQNDYDSIIKNVELSKENHIKVEACDGSAWEIIEYNNGKEIWKRDLGYIYGIKPLEKVAEILNKLVTY